MVKLEKLSIQLARVLIIISLVAGVDGLIASTTVQAKSLSLVPFSWFAYKSNGKFAFEARVSEVSAKPELILLVIAKEDKCKTIGKSCIYEIPEIGDICTSLNAKELQTKIIKAYPVIIPSENYTLKRNSSKLKLTARSWTVYASPSKTLLKEFIEENLVLAVRKLLLLPYLAQIESLSDAEDSWNNLSSVSEVTTKIDGRIERESYVYFSILNCNEQSVSLSLEYEFLNPHGEQLPSTDIPHKVKFHIMH